MIKPPKCLLDKLNLAQPGFRSVFARSEFRMKPVFGYGAVLPVACLLVSRLFRLDPRR